MVLGVVLGRMLMVFNGVEFMSVSHMCMVRCHMFVAFMVSLVRGVVVVSGCFKVLGCVSVVIVLTHNVLYGCLPGSKRNLCCVAKKSAALLYPALIAWSVWFPRLARWPRCISADKRLIS